MQPSIAFALFLAVSALPQTFTPPKLERQNAMRMREPAPLNRQNGERPLKNLPVPIAGADQPFAPLQRQNGQRPLKNLPVDAKPDFVRPKLERQNGVRLPEPEESGFNAASQHDVAAAAAADAAAAGHGVSSSGEHAGSGTSEHAPVTAHEG